MKTKNKLLTFLAGAVVVAGYAVVQLQSIKTGSAVAGNTVASPLEKAPAIPEPDAREGLISNAEISVASPVAKVETKAPVPKVKTKQAAKPKPAIQDPAARTALSLVGIDPEAEDYWFSAISDPSLPDNERKDLIEDLNEDGLTDPDHPSAQDMPVIAARLDILDQMYYDPNDPVVAPAVKEARKDLVAMLNGQSHD